MFLSWNISSCIFWIVQHFCGGVYSGKSLGLGSVENLRKPSRAWTGDSQDFVSKCLKNTITLHQRFVWPTLNFFAFWSCLPLFQEDITPITCRTSAVVLIELMTCIGFHLSRSCIFCWVYTNDGLFTPEWSTPGLQHTCSYSAGEANFSCGLKRNASRKCGLLSEKFAHPWSRA